MEGRRDAAVGLGFMAAAYVASVVTDFTGIGDMIGGAAVLLFTAALAVAVRYRRTAREHLVKQTRYQEREQLARELHDTVAHHVTAIAIQAQASNSQCGPTKRNVSASFLRPTHRQPSTTTVRTC